MSVEIRFEYLGSLRTRACHTPSGAEFDTDAPRDNQGKGESFSPTDLVATALGTCMLTVMGLYARKHDLDLTGMTAVVAKEMIADPLRRVSALPATVRLDRPIPIEHRIELERTARECPVMQSLDTRIRKDVTFEWAE